MPEGVRPPEGHVRPGRAVDEEEIRWITDAVFSVFGEYGSWLPGYLTHPGVWTFVYLEEGEVLGFSMLGMLEPEAGGRQRLGDLLAIAVSPDHQGHGIGTRLLEETTARARVLKKVVGLAEVRLTVAEPNEGARRLFERFHFQPLEGDHGHYDKGQRALRLRLKL
jgi:ribosomal protein S18 acetylase RimI-like enzyme